MTGVPFTRSHDVVIEAPGEAVYDYVTNPHSWPEWLAAFREFWSTRKGPVTLEWIVTESDRPKCWIGETGTDFTGPIVIRYDLAPEGGATRFTRTVSNPARPRPPTAEMIERMDAEAAQGLAAIKRVVEARG